MSSRIENPLGVGGREKIPHVVSIQMECWYHAFILRWVSLETPP
jgi:hypothetical protein